MKVVKQEELNKLVEIKEHEEVEIAFGLVLRQDIKVYGRLFLCNDSGNSIVDAYGNSKVYAYCNSIVDAHDNSKVGAYGNSKVYAYGNSKVYAYGNSRVYALDNSRVDAHDNSIVDAHGNSRVYALDNSRVYALDNSRVYAYDNSRVDAHGNSMVEAYDTSFVRGYSCEAIKLFANSILQTAVDLKVVQHDNSIIKKIIEFDYFDSHGLYTDVIILYKRVSQEFKTQKNTPNETLWEIGSTVTHPEWSPKSSECGEGKYHAVAKPFFADEFRDVEGDKYIAIEIKKSDCYEWKDARYPHKIAFREGRVLYECNRYGDKIGDE